jgi:hypothetical protein
MMTLPRNISITLIMGLVLLGTATSGICIEHQYIEEFTTTQYKDTINTTAYWDTATGELRLPFQTMSIIGTGDTPGSSGGIAVSGDHAYIGDYSAGLQVLDISDPSTPVIVGSYNTPGVASGVAISGNHVYVADYDYGLLVIDISDPTNPVLAGTLDTDGLALGVAIYGDHVLVADYSSGLQVVDISDPVNPTLAGTCDTSGSAYGVAVSGNRAYIADSATGLHVINIMDPANPTILGTCSSATGVSSVNISGRYAYCGGGNSGLYVIDISDSSLPALVASCSTPGIAYGISVAGDYAFVAGRSAGLHKVDISDPLNPTLLASCETPGEAFAVVVSGNQALVADGEAGMQVIQVSIPVTPVLVGECDSPGYAYDVTVSGNYAFVADGAGGLQVFDISNVMTPVLVGSYTLGHLRQVEVFGDYAFIAGDWDFVRVIYIGDPANPTYVSFLPGVVNTGSVEISGNNLFATGGTGGVGCYIFDVSNPSAPLELGSCSTPGSATDVSVSGNYAYVADDGAGLQSIDITDPTAPVIVGTYDTPGGAIKLAISGDYICVADGASGLQIVDITDPTNPTLAGSYDTPGSAQSVTVSGNYVFVSDGVSGLHLIDITDPTTPVLIETYDTAGEAYGSTRQGDHVFVADAGAGLKVIQVFEGAVDPTGNVGRSLVVDTSDDMILRARATTAQVGTVDWELSADGGMSWQDLEPDGTWSRFDSPGTDLLWDSSLVWEAAGDAPSVTNLNVEWLTEFSPISMIEDVPNDQGGFLRVTFPRSGYDFSDETILPVTGYQIYQRVDESIAMKRSSSIVAMEDDTNRTLDPVPLVGVRIWESDARYFAQAVDKTTNFPPGVWEVVGWVAASQADTYTARVTTTADSTPTDPAWSVYFITTHTTTPAIWFASQPDSGSSIDNIAPAVPEGFIMNETSVLSWDPSPETDFQYYTVYGSGADYLDESAILINHTTDTTMNVGVHVHEYYLLTASDYAGNASDATVTIHSLSAVQTDMPMVLSLLPCVPNPFNPSTSILFAIPEAGEVDLSIYDVSGRLIKTLVSTHISAGQKTAEWNGDDASGRRVASGTYFLRLETDQGVRTRKVMLAK